MPFDIKSIPEKQTAAGTPLAKNSINIYRAYLNKIAKHGVSTREELIANPKTVLSYIQDETKDIEDETIRKQKIRIFLSAIFWALNDKPLSDKQSYYDTFQDAKHTKK